MKDNGSPAHGDASSDSFTLKPAKTEVQFDPLVIATDTYHVIKADNIYNDKVHIGPAGRNTML